MRITFFVHGCFRIGNFHRSRHGNKFVNQVLITCRIVSFACNERNSERVQPGSWTNTKSKKELLWECKETKESPFCYIGGQLSSQERGVRTQISEIERSESYSDPAQSLLNKPRLCHKWDVIARPSRCDGQAADAVSACTGKKWRMLPDCS